ncbi:hypothetical protein E2C01_086660 [Portunus trituberculatus]|uniref:Uncharacterized protein n=1 Tax=Portunus trituberculatus TaxID=210409 RepID=A0A5B7JB00_PORTR|nr:hypothetical protein [Portunus trituberculatus]
MYYSRAGKRRREISKRLSDTRVNGDAGMGRGAMGSRWEGEGMIGICCDGADTKGG